MSSKKNTKSRKASDPPRPYPLPADRRLAIMRELHQLPGNKTLLRIMEDDEAQALICQLPSEDFFWLVKKVGDENCPALLRLASEEQWQYLLDLEIWQRDRLDLEQASQWIQRLQEADPPRLTRWVFGPGQSLAYFYLFQNIEVVITYSKEEVDDLPEGFFSVDGIFHVRAIDPDLRETVESLMQNMAAADYQRYQALILGLVGILPGELEEQMLRLRNVRLAEHGFLPFEEAISVYAPLAPEALGKDLPVGEMRISPDEDTLPMVPLSPLDHTRGQSILSEVIERMSDAVFLDRLRLEFAGLCNQILSADNLLVHDLDDLVKTCRRAAGYLNLALERLCGEDRTRAEDIVKGNALLTLFRVGFGLALKLKWQAERWVKHSWFMSQGFDFLFWEEHWGNTLSGILQKRPQFYAGVRETEEYRDFHRLVELAEGLDVLRRLMVLDALLDRITEDHPLGEDLRDSNEASFRTLLFTFWARKTLGLELGFQSITLGDVKDLLRRLRGRKKKPPYPMAAVGKRFVQDILDHASQADPEAMAILGDTLRLIWKQFEEEYGWVSLENLSGRHGRFFWITPSSEAAHR